METSSLIPIPDQTNFRRTPDCYLHNAAVGHWICKGRAWPAPNEAQKAKQNESWGQHDHAPGA